MDVFRRFPMLGGTLICLGGTAIVICCYLLFDSVVDKPSEVSLIRNFAIAGYLLWVIGSILLAQARFSSARAGLLCGLLLAPGLLLLLTVVPRRSRQQVWLDANPTLSGQAFRRPLSNKKSLY